MRQVERWILALGFGGLVLSGGALLGGQRAVAGAGFVMAGAGLSLSMLRCQREGRIRTNLGIFRRIDHPAGFRLQLGFWWLVTTLWTLAGLLWAAGLIGSPAPLSLVFR